MFTPAALLSIATRSWPSNVVQTHEMQRPKICARAGSATRLNAGSHPTGGCNLNATAGDETVEVRFSVSGSRSPLFVRLTETACCAVLAAPGVLTAPGSAPTIRPTAIATAITLLRARGGGALLLGVEKLLISCPSPRPIAEYARSIGSGASIAHWSISVIKRDGCLIPPYRRPHLSHCGPWGLPANSSRLADRNFSRSGWCDQVCCCPGDSPVPSCNKARSPSSKGSR